MEARHLWQLERILADRSVDAVCRGFFGMIKAANPSMASRPVSGQIDRTKASGGEAQFSATIGNEASELISSDHSRIMLAVGIERTGTIRSRALQVLNGNAPASDLLELDGGIGCAFAIYDRQSGIVTLARDAVGLNPVYFSVGAHGICFATEIAVLRVFREQGPHIDARAMAMFLNWGFSGGGQTALRGVERILPGEIVEIGPDLSLKRSRVLGDVIPVSETVTDFLLASNKFDDLFDNTVHASAKNASCAGLLLSGGLDSALICSALANERVAPIHTVSIGYDFTRERDELDEARRIATRFQTQHTELRLSCDALCRRLAYVVWQTDELAEDPASLPTSLLAEAFPDGATIFTGEGADDVFAGDGAYRRLPVQRWAESLRSYGTGGWRTRGQWEGWLRRDTLGVELGEAVASGQKYLVDAWSATPTHWQWIQRAQHLELASAFPYSLALKVSRNLKGGNSSVSVPFMDPKIIRFGLSLDRRLKVRGRTGKVFLREWAACRLPHSHVMKRKRGFHVPIGALLNHIGIDRIEPVLMASELVRKWFRPDGLKRLFDEFRASGRNAEALWRLLYLAIWHTIFIVGTPRPPQTNENPLRWIAQAS